MHPLLADVDNATIGLLVQSLTALLLLALTALQLIRGASGKDSERQVEPTEMHAITTELRAQTVTLNKLDREMGATAVSIKAVDDKVTLQGAEVANAFRRINAISMETAGTAARVEGLENRETQRKTI